MIHTVKGLGIVNKAEIDVFLELSCFLHDPSDVSGTQTGGATSCLRLEVAAGRSNPTPEARGSGLEEQPHVQGAVVARAQEGLEELVHVQGQEGRR